MPFMLHPFAATRACCTSTFRLSDVIRHMRPRDVLSHLILQPSISWVCRNWRLLLCMDSALSERYPYHFCKQSSISDVRTKIPLCLPWNSDPTCVVASQPYCFFVCSIINSFTVVLCLLAVYVPSAVAYKHSLFLFWWGLLRVYSLSVLS